MFHGDSRPDSSSSFFMASLSLCLPIIFFADWSRLHFSRRVSSLQDGVVLVFHGESLLRSSSFFFTASLFSLFLIRFLADRNRRRFTLGVSFLQDGVFCLIPGESLPFASSSFFTASLFLLRPIFFLTDCSCLCCFTASRVLAGWIRLRVSGRVSVFVFCLHGESLPFSS